MARWAPPHSGSTGWVKWRKRSGNSSDVIDQRGRRGGPAMAVPGGLSIVGVLVFLAVQLLGGGSAFSVPPGFEDGTTAPASEDIPPAQNPDRDLADFSEYVFLDAQEMWE